MPYFAIATILFFNCVLMITIIGLRNILFWEKDLNDKNKYIGSLELLLLIIKKKSTVSGRNSIFRRFKLEDFVKSSNRRVEARNHSRIFINAKSSRNFKTLNI